MTRTARVLAALVAALLVLAACSSGGGGDGGDDAGGGSKAHVTGPTGSPQKLGGAGPLAQVDVYEGMTQNHVEGTITYRQTPPVGGDHNPVPATCGAYDAPIPTENGVHSMEHGAVWITYRPSLPALEQTQLQGLVVGNPYVLVSPWADEELPSPIVLSAWGRQLGVRSATDPGVAAFIQAFEQGPQTPELGAQCAGLGSPIKTAAG